MSLPSLLSTVENENASAVFVFKQPKNTTTLPWIRLSPHSSYFITEEGNSWLPIGQNEAITWPGLDGFFGNKNSRRAEEYLAYLASHKVTCLRLMLEYCQTENRYLERPLGKFQTNMIRTWDDIFTSCEKYGIRVVLTPFDTFWMRKRWKYHPYNRLNGGTCSSKSQWLCCTQTLQAVKNRLSFAIERWGKSGVIFAWDLWNEPDPVHAGNSVPHISTFITELSTHIRNVETRLYGRTHLQTVGGYWPHLIKYPQLSDVIFRHPALDFATLHFYGHTALDKPSNTILPAIRMGELVQKALLEIKDNRPFFDSEHGPVRAYRKGKGALPEKFDEEYFRYTQWAHFASGAAGGGMRWPYRHLHRLTNGMHQAQKSLSSFAQLIDWQFFLRKNISTHISINGKNSKAFGCGNNRQAIVWVLSKDPINEGGKMVRIQIPGMTEGKYNILLWHTQEGKVVAEYKQQVPNGILFLEFSLPTQDIALLIQFIPED